MYLKTLLIFMLAPVAFVACGPKLSPEDIAKQTCKCISENLKTDLAEVEKLTTVDTSTFKQDMIGDASSKIEALSKKLDECTTKANEVEDNKVVLQDLAQKALYDEKVMECSQITNQTIDKAKSKLTQISEQFKAAASDTLKDAKDSAKNQLNNLKINPKNRGVARGKGR